MKQFIKQHLYKIIGILLFVAALVIYQPYVSDLPRGLHNWAQADRYSVAKMYETNGNFFEPRTHNLMTDDGRCGLEFPIIQYLSGRLSHFTNIPLTAVYRLFSFLLLFGGFLFFASQFTLLAEFGVAMSLLFSPVLFFYGFNFNPDTSGLALVLFSLAFVLKFEKTGTPKHVYFSILLAALAALIKTSCGVYFIALTGAYGLYLIEQKKHFDLLKLTATFVALTAVIALYDYFYFHKFNKDNWSIVFMSSSQPVKNKADLIGVWKAIKFWFGQYITWSQAAIICITFLFGFSMKQKKKTAILGKLLWIFALGLIGFLKMMGKQFIDHDYYYISTFVPLAAILISFVIYQTQSFSINKNYVTLGIWILLISSFVVSAQSFKIRMSDTFVWKNKSIDSQTDWMQNGAEILDEIGIDLNKKIFALYASAPNTALVYFDRRGRTFNFEEMTRPPSNMDYWFDRIKPDFIICPRFVADKFKTDQSKLYGNVVLFAKRPNFYIYKPI
ncbi:MAG: glycosyltransferase family 39 protein [Flavobacteriales bacterium]|nr:glycosyltransferase family 39 protein [Flavobacteriales bacterium]